jgi:hypothetical protein
MQEHSIINEKWRLKTRRKPDIKTTLDYDEVE